MGIDTVKLKSPPIDEGTATFLERQCVMKQGIDLKSGEILYEFTTGDLEGSYDSRISFRVMREDYVLNKSGRPELVPCKPYILTEASFHKVFFGQNIYGNPIDFQSLCARFIDVLGVLLCDDGMLLPAAKRWEVRRVDWAEVYRLSPEAVSEFFRGISHCKFPRRSKKSAKYGTNAVYFPGKTTTVKLYHKGPEFKEHDQARMKRALNQWRFNAFPYSWQYDDNYRWVDRKLKSLQRLANNRLRVEVEIHADKLNFDYGNRFPLVSEVTDDYLKKVHDTEIFKLLKEGKSEMETVRNNEAVLNRLNAIYGHKSANSLYAFWVLMSAQGEDMAINQYSKSQFYSNRKKLVDAGVSWFGSNVYILPEQTALPKDFQPVRQDPRRCDLPVRNDSVFNLCPTLFNREAA
jgi:II/X family phage/plasmid replication protein